MSRYNSGPLINLVMAAQGVCDAHNITPRCLNPQSQRWFTQFLRGLQVTATIPPQKDKPIRYHPINGIVLKGADQYKFTLEQTREEGKMYRLPQCHQWVSSPPIADPQTPSACPPPPRYVPPSSHPNVLPAHTDMPPALAIRPPSTSHCCRPLRATAASLPKPRHLSCLPIPLTTLTMPINPCRPMPACP